MAAQSFHMGIWVQHGCIFVNLWLEGVLLQIIEFFFTTSLSYLLKLFLLSNFEILRKVLLIALCIL